MRAVFLGFLRHQAHVTDVTHRRHVESTVLYAVVDDRLVDGGVAPIRDNEFRVVQLAVGPPHLPRGADGRGHGRVDDHVARHVEVRDAFVRVDHRHGRATFVDGGDIGFDLGSLCFRELFYPGIHIANAILRIDTELVEQRCVLVEYIGIVGRDGMPEHDRVRHLHHRCLEVQGEQHALLFCIVNLGCKERSQRRTVHNRRIDHFVREHRHRLPQHDCCPVGRFQLDAQLAGLGDNG